MLSQLTLGFSDHVRLPKWLRERGWAATVTAGVLLAAGGAAWLLFNLPDAVRAGRTGAAYFGSWMLALTVLFWATPLLWIDAWFLRRPLLTGALKLHVAALLALAFVTWRTTSPYDNSVGAAFLPFVWAAFIVWLAIDVASLILADRKKNDHPTLHILSAGLTILLGGWFVGHAVWAVAQPSVILVEARRQAAGRPYCLLSGPSLKDAGVADLFLAAWSAPRMRDHYAVLIIREPPSQEPKSGNWSFRLGRFDWWPRPADWPKPNCTRWR